MQELQDAISAIVNSGIGASDTEAASLVTADVETLIAAAGSVFLSQTLWPDLAVGALLAGLALHSSAQVCRQALDELRADKQPIST